MSNDKPTLDEIMAAMTDEERDMMRHLTDVAAEITLAAEERAMALRAEQHHDSEEPEGSAE